MRAPAPDAEGWQRIHPLSALVRIGPGLVVIAFALAENLSGKGHGSDAITELVIMALGVFGGLISWLVTRWRLDGSTLCIETGLLRRRSLRFPVGQIQAIDVVEPTIARMVGLAELRIRTAGAEGTAGRLSYLRRPEAEALRARILAAAHGLPRDTPAPPERPLLAVATGRLIASLALDTGALMLAIVLAAVIAVGVALPGAAPALGSLLAFAFGLAVALWRRFNAGFNLTVSEAPDGLRLRSGLLSQAAETIPRSRIQAARLIQPVLWRPFGWSRVEVQVAGAARRENRAARNQRRSFRTVLPVGRDSEARWLIAVLFPSPPEPDSPPPARARLKSPLSFHWLGWGSDERLAVTSAGRLRRVVHYVPLTKVQSLRFSEGPIQRRLKLVSVHLDTPGVGVHAVLRDRSAEEAAVLEVALPERCARARAAESAASSRRARQGT